MTRTSDHPGVGVRCGVDIVAISRIDSLLEEFGDSFRHRVFTPREQRYCESRANPPQHYAARFAAKEAFRKALPSAVPKVAFRSVGVVRERSGEPRLELHPDVDAADASTRDTLGGTAVEVSLSHDPHADRAIAYVTLDQRDRVDPSQ